MERESGSGTESAKRVREVMIARDSYPFVHPDDTLKRAVEVIEGSRIEVGGRRSLPRVLLVLTGDHELVGLVRRRDLMRGLEPKFLVSQPMEYRKKLFEVAVDPNLSEFTELPFDRIVKGLREQAGRPVRDVMLPVTATIGPDDHLMKAVYEMVSMNLGLLPVVESGTVLGVVRSVDVFHELAQLLR
jgi:predicted transcriptional regulator